MEMTKAKDWADTGAEEKQRLGSINSTNVLAICQPPTPDQAAPEEEAL